jgi:kynurenine formamidase
MRPTISAAEFAALFDRVRNWDRFGPDDELGALHHITAERRRAATSLAREGVAVSMAWPIGTEVASDDPRPLVHRMLSAADPIARRPAGGDRFDFAPHGTAITHLDALSHVSREGRLYGGVDTQRVTDAGAPVLNTAAFARGIVGRGVLIDVPRLRGVRWLEGGDVIDVAELERAEAAQRLRVGAGDLLFVRTGRGARKRSEGAFSIRGEVSGLDPRSVDWLHAREIAVLSDDGINESLPSRVEGETHPMHKLAIVAMGLPLLDNAQLEDVAAACAQRSRWEFLCVLAPLPVMRATGTPVNPMAIF